MITSISKIVMVIRIILDRKDLTDDFIWILPDETGLFTGQRHDSSSSSSRTLPSLAAGKRAASLASSVVLLGLPGRRQGCGDFQEQ